MFRKLPLLLVTLLLSGCAGISSTFQPPAPQVTFTSLPAAVAQMVTATVQPSATAVPAAPPTPPPTAISTLPPTPAQPLQAQSFEDCARTPGLGRCDPQAAASLTGLVTFVDAQTSRVVTVDLASGTGWQAPLPQGGKAHIVRMEWSPKGDQLAVFDDTGGYEIRGRDGGTLQNGTIGDYTPEWQPDGSLSLDGSVVNAEGRTARLEMKQDTSWHLLVSDKPGGAPKDLPVSPPTDRLYALRAWVPGTNLLLGQTYFASNAAMLVGGQVITIDSANGAVQESDTTAPLPPGGNFTWNPVNKTLLAFLQSGGPVTTARTIGLMDFATHQLRVPLADTLEVTDLAWSPDGERLAFAAAPLEEAPADVKAIFPGPGIYLLDPQTGKVESVVQSPQGASDGWLNWSTDGKALLYARAVGDQAEVRLHPLDGAPPSGLPESVLVNGLPVPESAPGPLWVSILAYTQVHP